MSDISIFQKHTIFYQKEAEFILLHNTTKINIGHRDKGLWYTCTNKQSTEPLEVHVRPTQSQTVALDFDIPVHVFTPAVSVYFTSSVYTMKQPFVEHIKQNSPGFTLSKRYPCVA